MRATSAGLKILCLLVAYLVCGGNGFSRALAAKVKAIEIAPTSITGTVIDQTGAVVPGAVVTATNQANGATTTAITSDAGTYTIQSVPPGTYKLSFSAHGFAPSQQTVVVRVAAALVVNANLGKGKSPWQPRPVATENYVRVSVDDALGPMGYTLTPSMASATATTASDAELANASQNSVFPSIILYISVVPLVYVPPDDSSKSLINKVQAAQETNRYPDWLDATFTLIPEDANGTTLPNACDDGSVQMIGILPNQTVGGTATPVATTAASAVNSVASDLSPLFPAVGSEVTAAAGALNVIFQDLLQPKPVAYQYANMNGNCEFGWYFRPNTSSGVTSGQSILGMQVGIVLLKTAPNVRKIAVSTRTLSQWNKRPTSYSKRLYLSDLTTLPPLSLPNDTAVDYSHVSNLSIFPALIPRAQAIQILHVKDSDFDGFVTRHNLVTTDSTNAYITNASLSTFLGLTTAQAPPAAQAVSAASVAPGGGAAAAATH